MRLLDAPGSGIREFPRKNDDLDASGRGWTAPTVIRNQQVSGSSPLAGYNRINNLQGFRGISTCDCVGTYVGKSPAQACKSQHRAATS